MSNIGFALFTELIVAWVAYVWGGAIKIGARPFWGRSMFVLVISNTNIGYQKSLTPSLIFILPFLLCFIVSTTLLLFLNVKKSL